MSAYYNEIDPNAAAWIQELINHGHIADGVVDTRSIEDVTPDDLSQFTQCHFFAGIGVWSYALRQSGWPDDRPIWTGSCPCQPFSSAGKGAGFADERHLWPAFHWLIQQCRPEHVLGEQVAGKAGEAWLDLVSTDLENTGYACGSAVTAACGFGAPHQRKRLYWGAQRLGLPNGDHAGRDSGTGAQAQGGSCLRPVGDLPGASGAASDMAHAGDDGREQGREGDQVRALAGARSEAQGEGRQCAIPPQCSSGLRSVADPASERWDRRQGATGAEGGPCVEAGRPAGSVADADHPRLEGLDRDGDRGHEPGRQQAQQTGSTGTSSRACEFCGHEYPADLGRYGCPNCGGEGLGDHRPGPTNGHWGAADWLGCRDGKWRPVEPGTFPLADGAPARVGRLRGYGNAIVAPQAQAFIESYMEATR